MRVDHVKKIWQRRNRNYMREHDHENGARRVPVAMGCHDVITENQKSLEAKEWKE